MRKALAIHALTLLAVVATLLLRHLLDPQLGDRLPLAFPLWAVLFAAWLGGWRPALLASLLGYVAGTYLFTAPRHTFQTGLATNPIGIVGYFLASTAFIGFAELSLRTRRRLLASESEANRQNAAFRAAEERLRVAHAAARMGTWDWHFPTGQIFWSEGLWAILGLPPSDEPQPLQRWHSFLHPDDIQPAQTKFDRDVAAGNDTFDLEFRIRRADGDIRWLSCKGKLVRDPAGTPVKAIGANLDITDLKRVEHALRDSEQQIRLLADALPALVAYVGPDLRYQFNNRAYADWFGLPADSLKGKHLTDMIDPAILDQRMPFLQQALAGNAVHFEAPSRHATRGIIDCEIHYIPDTAPDGQVRGFVVLAQDITARKRAEAEREQLLASERAAREEAERASDAKSEFLATLSHELRTPLTPALLNLSLLTARTDLPPDVRDDLADIHRNVELESGLIGDLLDLTRIAKGKLQLDPQPVDLHAILRSAVDICRRDAAAALHLHLDATRTLVQGDPIRLRQIFWNLLTNALKFTPAAGTITLRSEDLPNNRLRVQVIDTGEGIAPDVLPRLFNAFEQGDARSARQQAGLGLGLAISKRLAEAHSATITAHSEGLGKGAAFTFEIPSLGIPTLADGASTPPAQPSVPPATPALEILLVEDHEPTRRIMSRLLHSLGHRVTPAHDLHAARAAAAAQPFDLLISDLGLPDGSRLDLIRHLRPAYDGRAIALTGYGMDADIAASLAAGFAEHLTKPIDLPKLQSAIARLTTLPPRH